MTERVVGIFYRLALFGALYTAARRWGKIAAAGVVVIAMLVILHLWLFAIAWIMALALAVSSITLLARSLTSSAMAELVRSWPAASQESRAYFESTSPPPSSPRL
jgi:hypothetical protein